MKRTMRQVVRTTALAMVAGAAATAGSAQQAIPDVGNYSLPAPLASPTPQPTPTPTLTPPPLVAPVTVPLPAPSPTSSATPTARPTGRAPAAATLTAAPTEERRQRPVPVPSASPSAASSPLSYGEILPPSDPAAAPNDDPQAVDAAPAPPSNDAGWPWWVLVALVAIAGIAAAIMLRRRRAPAASPEEAPPTTIEPPASAVETLPASPVAPSAPVAPVAAPRFLDPVPAPTAAPARLDIDEPTVARAGLNLVTATADVTVVVRNASDAVARGVVLEVRLTSAQPGQDAAIAALFAEPSARPATPRFDLAPGEEKRVRTLATLPREAITVLEAGGRPMFVPVLAIRAQHADGQTVAVHALGIERPGQAKLGPIWLDQQARMYDAIGVRPHNARS